MSGSGRTPTKPVPSPRRGSKPKEPSASDKLQNFKTQFGNFKSGWISSENVFVGPTRKGKTLPKLADLLKNELFVVLEEGESFSTRVCSPCRTNLETALRCFRKLVEFIPKRIRFALPFTWVSSMMNTSVGTSLLKQLSLKLASGSVCQNVFAVISPYIQC